MLPGWKTVSAVPASRAWPLTTSWSETPFDPTGRDWKTFKQAAGFLKRNWRVRGKLFRVLDMLSMSAYDFLSEWFEDDRIKAILAYYASIGTFAGPRSPGTAYVIMHHVMGENAGAGGWGCPNNPSATDPDASPCELDPNHRNYFQVSPDMGLQDLAKSVFLDPTPQDPAVPPNW